jgi:hypothetical protein
MFFFEKKNQKTSGRPRLLSGHTVAAQKPWESKVFCFPGRGAFFSKKKFLLSVF